MHNLLADCLRSRDPRLWEALVRQLQPIFARIVYRVAQTTSAAQPGDVDDAIQECFLKIEANRDKPYAQLSALDSEQAAVAYLKVMAANTARDLFRKKSAEKRSSVKTTSVEDRLPEIVGVNASSLDRDVLIGQIDRLLSADLKERTIFWLYYRQGFTAKEISEIPAFQLGPKGVESLLRRLTLAVREQLGNQKGFPGPEASY